MKSVAFEWLSSGQCSHPQAITLQGGSWASIQFPSYFGVLRHPVQGVILYDTGYSDRFYDATRSFPEKLYTWITPVTLNSYESTQAQLLNRGIGASDVRWIIISHFHADHIAGLKDYPQARWIVSKMAWTSLKRMNRWRALTHGCLFDLLPDDFEARCVWWEELPHMSLEGSFTVFNSGIDLFLDGSILGISLPGHAHGQLGVYFHDQYSQPIFLVSDACWSSEAYESVRMPHPICKVLFNHWGDYRKTLENIGAVSQQNPSLLVMPSHCSVAHQRWKERIDAR